MKWFRDLKTGLKLALGFAASLLFAVAISVVAVHRADELGQRTQSLYTNGVVGLQNLASMVDYSRQVRLYQMRLVLTTDHAERVKLAEHLESEVADTQKSIDLYAKTVSEPEEKQNLEALQKAWKTYLDSSSQMISTQKPFQSRKKSRTLRLCRKLGKPILIRPVRLPPCP